MSDAWPHEAHAYTSLAAVQRDVFFNTGSGDAPAGGPTAEASA